MDITKQSLETKTLSDIASLVFSDWKNLSPHARPYLDAMLDLLTINDTYGADSAYTVVVYFLSNASGYRGDTAKLVKAELKRRVTQYEKAKS